MNSVLPAATHIILVVASCILRSVCCGIVQDFIEQRLDIDEDSSRVRVVRVEGRCAPLEYHVLLLAICSDVGYVIEVFRRAE